MVEQFLQERFEENLERIQEETGTGLAPDIEDMAFQQVLYYWRKLKDIATRVTETEVRLNLPSQQTPAGREYGIEGVVDIVREGNRTVMYDIKTHDAAYVRAHRDDYSRQLNIYAHVWQHLRDQDLDETAVITTSFPEKLREAISNGDAPVIEQEMTSWEPVIDIPFDDNAVDEAIGQFGEVVDSIEDGSFSPPGVSVLRTRTADNAKAFATRICRNCDARFSCRPYRLYAKSVGGKAGKQFGAYIDEKVPEWDTEDRLISLLEATMELEELEENENG